MSRTRIPNKNRKDPNRKGGTTRSIDERERDLAITAELYLKGYTQHEIKEKINENPEYNISQTTIVNDIKEIRKRWLDSQIRDFNLAKVQELAKIDQLERAYWEGWERSVQQQNTVEVEKHDDQVSGAGAQTATRSRTKRTTKTRDGAVDFLQGVERCINLRCKILGLTTQTAFKKDWEAAAREAGIPEKEANQQFESMVQTFTDAIKQGKKSEEGKPE